MAASDWTRVWPAAVVLLAACSTSDRFGDAGVPPDGGSPDAQVRADGGPMRGGGALGAPCESAQSCRTGFVCDTELEIELPASDLPEGMANVPASVFPGGVCTPTPRAPYTGGTESCDPLLPPTQQGCGPSGVCVSVSLDTEDVVACRPGCDPEAGCDRFGYTCDFELEACVEGCQSDEECRLLLVDGDRNGRADALAYDESSRAVCDTDTFRCTHPGGASAQTGDPCEGIDDCESEGTCLEALREFAGFQFPGGSCTKFGCDHEGRECAGEGSTCARLRSWIPGIVTGQSCFQGCTVGAEPEADRVGAEGHGEGCRPGYRCHYNGGQGAESGVCVGGVYNDVTENNVGGACTADSDCYSPFGLANCLRLSVGPVDAPVAACSIMDCAAPGLPDDVCGEGNQCIGLNGDLTFCVKTCKEASECPEGYACTDDDGSAATGKICYPACLADEDCREGEEACRLDAASGIGACVASRG